VTTIEANRLEFKVLFQTDKLWKSRKRARREASRFQTKADSFEYDALRPRVSFKWWKWNCWREAQKKARYEQAPRAKSYAWTSTISILKGKAAGAHCWRHEYS